VVRDDSVVRNHRDGHFEMVRSIVAPICGGIPPALVYVIKSFTLDGRHNLGGEGWLRREILSFWTL